MPFPLVQTRPLAITIHAAVTWYMVGIIWLVQLVHYPMFAALDREQFKRAHRFHSAAITWIVIPAMLPELFLSGWLLWKLSISTWPAPAGFTLVLVIWLTTFFAVVPLHERLQAEGFDPKVHRSLCRWNWVRTLCWSARGVLVATFLS